MVLFFANAGLNNWQEKFVGCRFDRSNSAIDLCDSISVRIAGAILESRLLSKKKEFSQ
jgi:hypothetical protein